MRAITATYINGSKRATMMTMRNGGGKEVYLKNWFQLIL
jgi:hypothetical protein